MTITLEARWRGQSNLRRCVEELLQFIAVWWGYLEHFWTETETESQYDNDATEISTDA